MSPVADVPDIEEANGMTEDMMQSEEEGLLSETKITPFEIEEIPGIATAPSADESIDEDIVELERLLMNDVKDAIPTSESPPTMDVPRSYFCFPCCRSSSNPVTNKAYRMGNIRVFAPRLYTCTGGWGVLGPHWFGPPCITVVLLIVSYYILYQRCYRRHWYGTMATGILLSASTLYHLLSAAYRDPGVIVPHSLPEPAPRSFRWCDACRYYQPPHAAHCPDCNVCVAGFDHHCVWMSLCIGVGNYKVRRACPLGCTIVYF